MIYLALPQTHVARRLPFFLAAEEWAARALPPEDYFFIWQQSRPTIICGRNQCIPAEVNLKLARERGVDVVRRRSGGGAVVADENNLMLSCIRPRKGRPVAELFAEWSEALASALRDTGLDAQASGRNDICIDGLKVSGGAFYALPERAIAHSTLLFRRPAEELLSLLTPARAKLESKGVKSVAARIGSLVEAGLGAINIEDLRHALRKNLCGDATIDVEPRHIREIEDIENKYYAPDFLKLSDTNHERRAIHIPGTGTVAATFTAMPDGSLENIQFSGDFFACGDVDALARSLEKLPRAQLREHIRSCRPQDVIPGLNTDALTNLLTNP